MPDFHFPAKRESTARFGQILEPAPAPEYAVSSTLWQDLQDYAAQQKASGNGFGFGIANPDGVARTLSARYHKGWGKRPRRLTARECSRLMGFDEWCEDRIVVSDTQACRQFGNAIVPKVIEAVGREILRVL